MDNPETTTDPKKLFSYKERLEHFNKSYELELNFKDKIIDLTKCKQYSPTHGPTYINKDLSRIFFDHCTELYLPNMSVKLSELKPKMKKLKKLYIHNSRIRTLCLDPSYFQNLELLSLVKNNIHTYNDIKDVISNLPHLKKINLSNNPICEKSVYLPELNKIKRLYKHLKVITNL